MRERILWLAPTALPVCTLPPFSALADRVDLSPCKDAITQCRNYSCDDAPPGQYYAEPVAWAVEKGITDGTSDYTFSPNLTCTRGQIVTFLYRAMK